MSTLDQIIAFLQNQGPFLGLLIVNFYRGEAIRAQHQVEVAALQTQLGVNHGQVESNYSGKSDADIVDSIAGTGQPDIQPDPTQKSG